MRVGDIMNVVPCQKDANIGTAGRLMIPVGDIALAGNQVAQAAYSNAPDHQTGPAPAEQ
jgi:hypothetical protein